MCVCVCLSIWRYLSPPHRKKSPRTARRGQTLKKYFSSLLVFEEVTINVNWVLGLSFVKNVHCLAKICLSLQVHVYTYGTTQVFTLFREIDIFSRISCTNEVGSTINTFSFCPLRAVTRQDGDDRHIRIRRRGESRNRAQVSHSSGVGHDRPQGGQHQPQRRGPLTPHQVVLPRERRQKPSETGTPMLEFFVILHL